MEEKDKTPLTEEKLKIVDLKSEQQSSREVQILAESSKRSSYLAEEEKRLKRFSINLTTSVLDADEMEMLQIARKQMSSPISPSSSESFSNDSDSCPSNELEAVEEFRTWMERTCSPPKTGAEEGIPTDIYNDIEVSYNEDLQLRIKTETNKDQVVQFNSGEATGSVESSHEEIVG